MYDVLDELEQDYMDKPSLIPIKEGDRIIAIVPFEPNLNRVDEPSYVNEGCNIGLKRIDKSVRLKLVDEEKYRNQLVMLFEDEFYPTQNRGLVISENDAYELCIKKGKNALIKKLNIQPDYGEG